MMPFGNCLLGMIMLAIRFGFRGRPVVHWCRDLPWLPHFCWRGPDGRLHDYTVVDDILPWPLFFIAYRGRFRIR